VVRRAPEELGHVQHHPQQVHRRALQEHLQQTSSRPTNEYSLLARGATIQEIYSQTSSGQLPAGQKAGEQGPDIAPGQNRIQTQWLPSTGASWCAYTLRNCAASRASMLPPKHLGHWQCCQCTLSCTPWRQACHQLA
jgi:hypothetical protein